MTTVRSEQIEALDEAAADSFAISLDRFLRNEGLLASADPEDPLADTDRLIGLAHSLGLSTEMGIVYYAILACLFGECLEGVSDQEWFQSLARDAEELPEPDWIERVFYTVVECSSGDQSYAGITPMRA